MSKGTTKPTRLSAHARGHSARRGFTVAEVEQAIRQGAWQPARQGRQQASLEFPYNADWNGTFYATKRVRPVFVEEATEIVVVTVYTYFFCARPAVRIRYDPEVDALSIVFRETTVTTRELADGVVAEYDAQGRLAGLEVLDASANCGDLASLRSLSVEGLSVTAPPA